MRRRLHQALAAQVLDSTCCTPCLGRRSPPADTIAAPLHSSTKRHPGAGTPCVPWQIPCVPHTGPTLHTQDAQPSTHSTAQEPRWVQLPVFPHKQLRCMLPVAPAAPQPLRMLTARSWLQCLGRCPGRRRQQPSAGGVIPCGRQGCTMHMYCTLHRGAGAMQRLRLRTAATCRGLSTWLRAGGEALGSPSCE